METMTMTLMWLHEISMLKLKTVNGFTKQTHRETTVVLITPLPFPNRKMQNTVTNCVTRQNYVIPPLEVFSFV